MTTNTVLKYIAVSVAILGLAGCPDTSRAITGRVFDADSGAPVCGALVVLRGVDISLESYTRENGVFLIPTLGPGEYTVQVIGAVGYAPSEVQPVTVTLDDEGMLNPVPALAFALHPGESEGGQTCQPDDIGCAKSRDEAYKDLRQYLGECFLAGQLLPAMTSRRILDK